MANVENVEDKKVLGCGEDRINQIIVGEDFSEKDLNGINFSGSIIRFCNLKFCNLRGADLSNCTIVFSDLSYAKLNGADLSGARIAHCNMFMVDLRCADISYDRISYTNMESVDMDGTKTKGLKMDETKLSLW